LTARGADSNIGARVEGMTALFFGDSGSALLGVWSPPDGEDRNHGVVICPPIGQEHVRTHWALRQVATALARAGFHAFRFDWFGVGDSAGELREASLARWQVDLATAVQELRDTAGVQRVSLVGLRMGATIAALAADAVRPTALVLWDPIVDGRAYVATLRSMTKTMLTDRQRYWNPDPRRVVTRPTELVGFEFGEQLVADLEHIDLRRHQRLPRGPVRLLDSCDDADLASFGEHIRASNHDVEITRTVLRTDWASVDEVERLLLPGDALRVVTSFLEAHA